MEEAKVLVKVKPLVKANPIVNLPIKKQKMSLGINYLGVNNENV